MTSNNIKPFIAYSVTKDSTDKTFCKGDIIWLSDNGDLNIAHPNHISCLEKSEWSAPQTSDFEIKRAIEYKIFRIGQQEICCRY